MRYLLLTLLVFALAAPALAGKSEYVLQQSDDTRDMAWYLDNYGGAQWFTAPAGGCHIISVSLYVRYSGTKDVVIWDNDDSGPDDFPGTILGSVSHGFNYGSSWVWSGEIDLTGEGVMLTSGEKFWCGIPPTPGETPHLGLDYTDPDYGEAYDYDGTGWNWNPYYEVMIRVTINDDTDGPYADEQNPADGDSGVAVDANIEFDIQDDDEGVDATTISNSSVIVTDDNKAIIPGTIFVNDDDINDVQVLFDPDNDFTEGSEVTVTVSPTGNKVTDILYNEMAEDSWSFTVYTTGVESSSLGEIKAGFAEPEGDGAAAPGAETVK